MRKATVFVAVLAVQALSACNAENDASEVRIVGGANAQGSDRETLSTVALVKDNFTFCTGTIVGPRQILSAAHCFAEGAAGVSAAFGVTATTGSKVKVAQAFVHEGYKNAESAGNNPSRPVNDISLLVLESDIPSGFVIAPVAPASLSIPQGATVSLAGYGVTRTGGQDTGRLLKVDTIMGSENAAASELTVGPTKGRGSCQGDSGGPSYYTANGVMYVFGVTSRGPECEAGIGIYTDARKFIAWMEGKGSFKVKDGSAGAPAPAPAPANNDAREGATSPAAPAPAAPAPAPAPAPAAPAAPAAAANPDFLNQLLSVLGQMQTAPATGGNAAPGGGNPAPSGGGGGGW